MLICVVGNEHSAFVVWMYSFGALGTHRFGSRGGFCTRTQYWSRRLTHMHYSALPNGIPGNDDYGSMSSWLLFASLGFFPQAGTINFVIGSPRIVSATVFLDGHGNNVGIHGDQSRRFIRIQTYNNSEDNVYVQKLLVNGKAWESPIISRHILSRVGGCELEFFMTSEPLSGLCA